MRKRETSGSWPGKGVMIPLIEEVTQQGASGGETDVGMEREDSKQVEC